MKVNQKILDKPLGEVMDALNDPEKQKDMTFADLMSLVQIMESAANASAKLQNPQSIPSDLEIKMVALERRIKALEEKLETIHRAFTGGYDYD